MAKIPVHSTPSAEGFAAVPFAALDAKAFQDRTDPSDSLSSETTQHPSPKKYRVVLRREKARRGGKTVIVVSQFPTHLSPPELDNLAKRTRKSLGCGGQLIGREIELQGDQPERVRAFLDGEGFAPVGPG